MYSFYLTQTTPTECDNLRSILKLVETVGSEGKTRQYVIDACLSDITEGVCRPLRSRVEQIMVSESTPGMVTNSPFILIAFFLKKKFIDLP